MITAIDLENAIRSKIADIQYLNIEDQSAGCGAKYVVVIVSDVFAGKTTLARHRMVNDLLKAEIAEMHAFSQKTYTVKQYEDMKVKEGAA